MKVPDRLELIAVPGVALVRPGDDLAVILIAALEASNLVPRDRDVLVVAQKVVSKAENRYVDLDTVNPSPRARSLAAETGKDPRLVEVILGESTEVIRSRPGLIIVEHLSGAVVANAGVDQSNVEPGGAGPRLLLLPRDPNASSKRLKSILDGHFGVCLGVIISDSVGRAWRAGTLGQAIGLAGVPAIFDLRGRPDLYRRPLEVSQTGYADSIAGAAALLMGEGDEGCPLVIARGLDYPTPGPGAPGLLRARSEDLFR